MAKILVLEDDKDLNKSVCTFLSLKNHEPIGFLNAEEAIESLENNKYDIIISDVMMNTMNGFEFAETIRSFNTTIPILFMTALDDINSKTKGYKIGIDDYMVKPVNLDELNLRIGALLKRSGMEEKIKITVGDFIKMNTLLFGREKKYSLQRENLKSSLPFFPTRGKHSVVPPS